MRKRGSVSKLISIGWGKRACGVFVLCATATMALSAQTFTTLHRFGDAGVNPAAALVQATDGNLYGTTFGNPYGTFGGTIFKITPSGTLTRLYSFPYGADPAAGLVQAANGDFYGTIEYGGANGNGTIFKITRRGTLTTLYSFCSQGGCADGGNPYAGLVQATNGNF
jgi:uncharacterized repeat protein (TIGR03803 family)